MCGQEISKFYKIKLVCRAGVERIKLTVIRKNVGRISVWANLFGPREEQQTNTNTNMQTYKRPLLSYLSVTRQNKLCNFRRRCEILIQVAIQKNK
jgi:hypothetical protein